jgi:hypothetical protein
MSNCLHLLPSVLLLAAPLLRGVPADTVPNQLTPQETADGWILLFDGRTWKNFTLSRAPHTTWWKIEDGWIESVTQGNSDGSRRLATLESFRDFELQFEWKIAKEGNSGVKYRIQRVWPFQPEDLQTGKPDLLSVTLDALESGTAIGFEYQLTDDENAPDALDSPYRSSASLYRLVAPRKSRPVRAGTPHSSRIKVVGADFEHWLDGRRVAAGDLTSVAIRTVLRENRATGSRKFETATEEQEKYNGLLERVTADTLLRFDSVSSPIDFQHHLSGVWFRNIKIRRLRE